jgi:cellulose synthase/poly-beta-1,6-N-acetylglucosamine synthase-like glycosyltransferase
MNFAIGVLSFSLAAVAITLSAYTLVVSTVLLVEIVASLWTRRPDEQFGDHPALAVLVPAHNESAVISRTLANIKQQLRGADRCVVVADNCTDNTASLAREAGAEVVERHNEVQIGKGYALDYGIQYLRQNPPPVLVVLDADCSLSENGLATLAAWCHRFLRPVQALDLMIAPPDAAAILGVSEFAWRIKNHARPLGLYNLHLPCHLMGTGMAFPWTTITTADVATSHIVEDVKLGLDLAEKGHTVMFCPAATVISFFPREHSAARRQRQRWEGGQLATIARNGPRFLAKAIQLGRPELLMLAIDLMVPPLSILAAVLFATLCLSFVAFAAGVTLPLGTAVLACLVFFLAISIGWRRYGRDIVPAKSFHLIAKYVWGKATMYLDLVLRGSTGRWLRTDRD